jgi:2-amino-4-hydroxy-6-hydroxymethyldihydropteridine diphosphokinase
LAVELIDRDFYSDVDEVSSVYETVPYGELNQENFFNAVCKISTQRSPSDLFNFLKNIELQVGRKKNIKWGPREIDLDILFYGSLVLNDEYLTIPHKDILNRDFVLVPLCEVAPEFVHPVINKKICDLILPDSRKYIVRKIPHKVLV